MNNENDLINDCCDSTPSDNEILKKINKNNNDLFSVDDSDSNDIHIQKIEIDVINESSTNINNDNHYDSDNVSVYNDTVRS